MSFLLDTRQRGSEIMDRPDLDAERHGAALCGLARINAWSGSARILWPAIERLARERSPGRGGATQRALRLLDLATGSGDVPIRLALRARRCGVPLEIAGSDRSPFALAQARDRAQRHGLAASFFEHDALADELPVASYDIITCSLFLHHLSDGEARTILAKMRQAARFLVVVCDLDRRADGLALTWVTTRILTRSAVVHFDGPASVRAAFTPGEIASIAARAGLAGVVIRRRWPCRWLLEWRTPSP